jgi:hypothetical protein
VYRESSDVWLHGETPLETPFAAQLHSVFSYAPVSFVFQTGLVVGDLHVHQPFRTNGGIAEEDLVAPDGGSSGYRGVIEWRYGTAPFSSFFDLNHFTWYWWQHRLKVISLKFYSNCFEFDPVRYETAATTGSSGTANGRSRLPHLISNVTRIPEFFPYAKDDFKQLIYYSNTTSNETFQFPFEKHRLVKIVGRFNMVGFYNFFKDLPMLTYVYTSIKPAIPIDKFSKALISLLSPNPPSSDYIAIHLRVDDEAFSSLENNKRLENDYRVVKRMVSFIKEHACLSSFFPNSSSSASEPILHGSSVLPALYLSTNAKPQTRNDKKRLKKIIEELGNIGFVNIYTRRILYDKYARKRSHSSAAANGSINPLGGAGEGIEVNPEDLSIAAPLSISALELTAAQQGAVNDLNVMRMLNPEQLSYVDMIVSRSSKCFIPSLVPSITSYMIKRFMKMDQNMEESYDQVNEQTYGNMYFYRDWGL